MQLPVTMSEPALAWDAGERDLIDRARRDREAFALIYRRHYAMIAGYLYRRTGDPHVTEDLAADVFLTALRYLPRYRHRGVPLKAWLYRIATTTVNRWARRQRLRRMKPLGLIDGANEPTAAAGPTDRALETEIARRAMLAISPKHQAVLSLHYLEGLSLEDIAAILGCRVGTVKSRLSRGRDALRAKLSVRSES